MRHHVLVATIVLAACQGAETVTSPSADLALSHAHHAAAKKKPAGTLPVTELAQVRKATARYHSVKQALKDGYVDINVVRPNMGRHRLKMSLVNSTFTLEEPELLVYSEGPGSKLKLVAVEYAIPLGLAASAPEGFTGTSDEWFPSDEFGLWLLHAWVWKDNPDGVLNPTNPSVP